MKKKIDSLVQKIIIRTLVVLILAASQFYVWRWVEDLANQLHNQRTIEQQVVNLEAQLAELESQAGVRSQVDEQINAVTIQQEEISQAIERLEQKAQELQLNITTNNINTENTVDNSNFSPLVITATVRGPVQRLLQYMEAVEHITEVTRVRNFSLVANAQPAAITGEQIHTLSLNVVFLTDKLEDDSGQSQRKNFVFNTTPPPPSESTNMGLYVIGGSSILLLIAIGYKIRQRQKV